MGEKIFDLVKEFACGKHSRKFWGIVILLVILFLIVFPYIDANFLYYNRIEKRIDNLSALVELSGKTIEENSELISEYNSIIEDINAAQTKSLVSAINRSPETNFDYWIKFAGGGILLFIVGIAGLCQKKKDEKYTFSFFMKNNFLTFVGSMILAVILALFFSFVPTIGSVWINFVATPILQIMIVYLLFIQPKRK